MGYILVALSVFGLDFLVKKKVDKELAEGESRKLFDGRLILEKHYNKGLILNLFQGFPNAVKIFNVIVILKFLFCYTVMVREKGNPVKKIGSAMALGGGVNNLYDRLTKNHVVDYLRVPVERPKILKPLSKIVFNLSDCFILIGSLFMIFGSLGKKK